MSGAPAAPARFWAQATGGLGALWTPDGGYVDDPPLATQNLMQRGIVRWRTAAAPHRDFRNYA